MRKTFDENQEEEYRRDRAYLQAEKELKEKQLMQVLFEEEMSVQPAKIVLGQVRKAGKFGKYAKVSLRKFFRKPDRYKRKDVHRIAGSRYLTGSIIPAR